MQIKSLFHKLFLSFAWLLLLVPASLFAQFLVNGYVIEASSGTPMNGVSVFYDGTTIGTITDENGYFELKTKEVMTTDLVISNIGFISQVFNGGKTGFLDNIYLKENTVVLNEVVLYPDTWSRKKKLRIFKKEFLGRTKAGLKCKILNEEDLRLHYDKAKNTLFAYTWKPIVISNRYLGYEIIYDLLAFEVAFVSVKKEPVSVVKEVYTKGNAFFKEIGDKMNMDAYSTRRMKVYLGSKAHFMQSLATNRLADNGYKMFVDKLLIVPNFQNLKQEAGELTKVAFKSKSIAVRYKSKEESILQISGSFYVDAYGNFTPPRNILFKGVMGAQRVGDLLPLDYVLSKPLYLD